VAVADAPGPVSISTTLYSRLTTRSGLLAALSKTGPTQQIDATAPLEASCLPASSHGGAALTIDVITSSTTAPSLSGGCIGSTHAPTLDLRCEVGTGSCNGVYPLAITVQSASRTLSTLVTLLTFVEQSAEVPLRVSTIVRMGASSLGASSASAVAKALEHVSTVPIDLAIDPTLIQRLSSSAGGRATVAELASQISTSGPNREVLAAPYVTVDPGVLASSGISGQLTSQLDRGDQILKAAGLAPTNTDTWLATSPVTASTTPALASAGINQLIVPDGSLAEPTAASLDWGQPFSVDPGSSSVSAMAADGVLTQEAASGSVLGAMQLLGDLSLLHFERPSLSTPQGVVVETTSSSSSASFLSAFLGGLEANPILEPITVSGLFAQVPVGANGSPTTRHLADTAPSPPWPQLQQVALSDEQQRQRAFKSALLPATPILEVLHDQLLASEADSLSSVQRGDALSAAASTLDRQIAEIAISGAGITITALRSSIPVTLTSQTGYQVTGVLHLSSAHIRFPSGDTFTEILSRPTRSLRIDVAAVTTGDLPLFATLRTPTGDLVLARQRILVHATHTSIVAIILTIGAAIVLLFWWIRTWWRKPARSRRRVTG
jgi:hypothetical protein